MKYIINSNDGWQKVEFFQKKIIDYSGKKTILFQLCLSANFWNREDLLNDSFNELVIDKTVRYEQLCISYQKWNNFLSVIETWKKNSQPFEFDLYSETGEFIKIVLEISSDELIVSKEKPLLKIIIKDSRTKIEYNMIVDGTSFPAPASL